MNLRVICAAAAFIVCSGIAVSQDRSIPHVSDADLPGLHVVRQASYDGNSLWGYIDGGADVYLEYGFSQLLAVKAEQNGVRYQIDCYRMNDAESAYGIFSISAFNCAQADSFPIRHCLSRYQMQIVCGPFYCSIINDKGTDDARMMNLKIARIIAAQIDSAATGTLPALFRLSAFNTQAGSVKFIKGLLGVQNGYPAWEDLFGELRGYSMYVMPVHSDSLDAALGMITFRDKAGRTTFFTRAGFDNAHIERGQPHKSKTTPNATRCLWSVSGDTVVFLEARTRSASALNVLISEVDAFFGRKNEQR
ncbi:MAG TPA: DUF6599 family protein [Bacteroidota bacterium]|nr:DUF6599 family protein [Bacteroidota bacterium]